MQKSCSTAPLALKQADPRFIRERFSVTLERTVHELRGNPCIALEEGRSQEHHGVSLVRASLRTWGVHALTVG